MSQLEPINFPLGVMQSLHRLETLAYDPARNELAGAEMAWTDDVAEQPARRRPADVAGNLALICAILMAAMMLGGFAFAIVEGRLH